MRILQINKYYPFDESIMPSRPYSYGGSETVISSTALLLKKHGNEVMFFSMMHPDNIPADLNEYFVPYANFNSKSMADKLKIAGNIFYSFEAKERLGRLLDRHPVDIAHLNNFHHQISPSILSELQRRKIPVVMSLHDYKMVCPSYRLLNHGRVCELCKGGNFYKCFIAKCHKDSFSKSLIVTLESYLHHNMLRSYASIKSYICPSMFIMDKVKDMGLKGDFVHLPHFIDSSMYKKYIGVPRKTGDGVYWGRLSKEKGIETLVEAVKGLPVNITIIGDGPLRNELDKRINDGNIRNVKLVGNMRSEELLTAIARSSFSVVPSEWYEVFGLVILEAFSMGLPVIGSRIGGIPELIKDGENGFLFEPCNAKDLRDKISKLVSDPAGASRMGAFGIRSAEKEHDPESYYERLMETYEKAIKG